MSTSHGLVWLGLCLTALFAGACSAASDAGPAAPATCLEGVSAEDCSKLQELVLPATLPPARGNEHAEDFNSALLGFHVFFDSRFSKNTNVRCESCHSVDHAFGDNLPVSTAGLSVGVRNAPTIFNAARYDTFFWDGRADTLWSQPLFAFENPTEMGFSRLEIAHLLGALYADEYADAFGALPDVSDLTRFPASGKPGDAEYDGMTPNDQATVNGVVANLGKALEAYMRKIATGPSPVDAYLADKFSATPSNSPSVLTDQQARGVVVFANSGCLQCHTGPQLSDDQFHNLGVPAADPSTLDQGRSEQAIDTRDHNPFNSAGHFFDGSATGTDEAPVMLGGFRTPSLRNLPKSAPYGHNGTFSTLEEAVDFHLRGGGTDAASFVGSVDVNLQRVQLSDEDRAALLEFLKALAGSYPALPWGQWPNGNG
ncbi:MAG: cytochrome c peroxidase [Polyangiaceae bacterium]